jgi:zinc-binding alcohol dehydrogenase/oxidoreductase
MEKMRAIILQKTGDLDHLKIEKMDKPVPKPGEALVRIKASALNHRDVWIVKGLYAKIKLPVILGSDGTGVVEAVGSEEDQSWLGKSVLINPTLNWGENLSAQSPDFGILGMPENGTLADFTVVPVSNFTKKPEYLSFEEAAAIPLGGITGYRALFRQGELKEGENLLLTGIGGGVATLMLKMARTAKANIFVTSGDNEKIEKARQNGAMAGVNYRPENWVKNATELFGANKIDIVVDSAGGAGFNDLIELVKPGGRLVVFGATAGNVPELNLRRIFWKQIRIQGTTMGHPQDFKNMIRFFDTNQIKPIIDHIFTFEEYQAAFQRMADSKQFGKIVIKNEK